MTFTTFTSVIVLSIVELIILLAFMHILFNIILTKYKKNGQPIESIEGIALLNELINMNIALYDEAVFSQVNGLTKDEFDAYLKEICIVSSESMSTELEQALIRIMSEDALYLYIKKRIQIILMKKMKEIENI